MDDAYRGQERNLLFLEKKRDEIAIIACIEGRKNDSFKGEQIDDAKWAGRGLKSSRGKNEKKTTTGKRI